MFLDYYSFLSYHPPMEPNNYALLGDEYISNISVRGTAVFTMNGHLILVCNSLHSPSLQAPLHSTQRCCTQPGCAYYDYDTVGNILLFPTMVINVESTTDNIVSFFPISRTLRDRKLNYTEPRLASSCLTNNPLFLESGNALIPTQLPKKYPIPNPLVMLPSKHPRPAP